MLEGIFGGVVMPLVEAQGSCEPAAENFRLGDLELRDLDPGERRQGAAKGAGG